MTHLLLNSTIAKKLWKYFASSAGINIEGLNFKQVIYRWWNEAANPKLMAIYKVLPGIVMWELWKRRNAKEA